MDDGCLNDSLFGDLDQAQFDEPTGQEGLTEGLDTFLDSGSVSYAPSVVQTDFSGHLPMLSVDPGLELSKHYSVSAVVGSAWTSLQSEVPKLPWEQGFWNDFLDPTKSALDCLHGGYKRPVPYHYEGGTAASSNSEVERRVVAKTFPGIQGFLKHIRDVQRRAGRKRGMLFGRLRYADGWQFWMSAIQVTRCYFTRCMLVHRLQRRHRSWLMSFSTRPLKLLLNVSTA